MVTGRNLDVVQQPILAVWVEPVQVQRVRRRRRLALLTSRQQLVFNSTMTTVRSASQSEIRPVFPYEAPPLTCTSLHNVR